MADILQPMEPYALLGRIVTMDGAARVIENGAIYIKDGCIAAVMKAGDSAPDGFKDCLQVKTNGTIYPGLIELHNHLSYNILPLWNVPETYKNRGQWKSAPAKRKFISGPMELLNDAGGYLGAIVRYVEAKCLLAGVTTSQGLTLVNASGIEKKYRGIVRNAEEPDDARLPKAGHKIDDIKPVDEDREKFLTGLKKLKGCFLLHLSEGIDEEAQKHFLGLKFESHAGWAITDALAGIHAAGLHAEDIDILQQFGGSIVWSPLSNLMLYGDTTRVKEAKSKKVLIALGSDWSPSGSKNLLGELKIAKLYSHMAGDLFTDFELVQMVTSAPARILKWQDALGTIESPKLADLFVIKGHVGEPYGKLISSTEADIQLVVIGGMPRYGTPGLMKKLHQKGEKWLLGNRARLVNLGDVPDAAVSTLTLKQAKKILAKGMASLPNPPAIQKLTARSGIFANVVPLASSWRLDLDNDGAEALASRAFAPLTNPELFGELMAPAPDIHTVVTSMELDELTVAENPGKYLGRIGAQRNLPDSIKQGLPALYGL